MKNFSLYVNNTITLLINSREAYYSPLGLLNTHERHRKKSNVAPSSGQAFPIVIAMSFQRVCSGGL